MPSLMGHDSDSPLSAGEVGREGVAVDSLDDMEQLFDGIPLGGVTTSMTINGPAAILLAMFVANAERQGTARASLGGTLQNDILKEYQAQKEFVFPPRPSMRLVRDVIRFTAAEMPRWHPVSISGYHIREAGSTAAQELAFTVGNGFAYVEAALAAGLDIDAFAPRLSFFFNAHIDFFEEIAKYRAARRIWARWLKERYGAKSEKSLQLRFHTQTAGVQLTAQQPEVNLARVTVQALAAVLGGTQSLHTNAYDEAIALPSEKAARLALRTQQVLAHETDLTATVDPFAGSYAIESMTDDLESAANDLIARVEDLGGAVAAIERGFQKAEIERSAYQIARQIDDGERVVVGVNKFISAGDEPYQPLRVDPSIERDQAERLARLRAARDAGQWQRRIDDLRKAAAGSQNVLVPLREALRAQATVGEVCDALRDVWGVYQPAEIT